MIADTKASCIPHDNINYTRDTVRTFWATKLPFELPFEKLSTQRFIRLKKINMKVDGVLIATPFLIVFSNAQVLVSRENVCTANELAMWVRIAIREHCDATHGPE